MQNYQATAKTTIIDDLFGRFFEPMAFVLDFYLATGECVIAIPAVELATKAVEIGNVSGHEIDKFQAFGLTPLPAEQVAPQLIAKCFANLECKLVDSRLVNKYNLFVMEVVQAWCDPEQPAPKTFHHQGYGRFVVDGNTLELASRMR